MAFDMLLLQFSLLLISRLVIYCLPKTLTDLSNDGSKWSIELKLLMPSNLAIIGETAYLHLQVINKTLLSSHDEISHSHYLPSNIVRDTVLTISVNGIRLSATRNLIDNIIYESTLCQGVFRIGENTIELVIYSNSSGKFLMRKELKLYSLGPIDDNFDSLLRMTDYDRSKMKQHSYIFFGISKEFLERAVLLEAKRWEGFSLSDKSNCPDNLSINQFNVHYSLDALASIGYVDHSYLNLSSIQSKSFSKIDLAKIIHRISSLTRKSILLFIDYGATIGNLMNSAVIDTIEKEFYFQQIFFNKNEIQNGVMTTLKDRFLRGNTTVWFRSQTPDIDVSVFDSNSRLGLKLCSCSGRSTTVPSSKMASHLLFESYKWGRSHVLLKNVCMAPRAWLQQRQILRPTTALPQEDLVVITNHHGSIFNLSFLAEEEDHGFLYTGIGFIDVKDETFPLSFREEMKTWPIIRGMTGVTFSVQGGHIVHETEPFAQFLAAVEYIQEASENSSNSCDFSNLAHHYGYIGCKLRRVIFAKLTTETVNDWILKMTSLIFAYFEESIQQRCSKDRPEVNQFACLTEVPSLILKDHIYFHSEPELGPVHCFEELLLLGRATTHSGFFRNQHVASLFKQFVYSKMNVREGTVIHEEEKISFRSGDRLLRITVALRAGPQRLIMNLPEVLQLFLSLRGREADGRMNGRLLVDKEWLLSHVQTFDKLTFRDQVELMAQTDVFISVHGAALFNGIFMRDGSAAIDILNGRFIEYVFTPPLRYSKLMQLIFLIKIQKSMLQGSRD